MWTDYFSCIKLINLKHRIDRLESATKILNEYGIPFERVEAIYDTERPCVGLVKTMKQIFFEAKVDGHERVLIFEDDLKPLVAPAFFNSTMDVICEELARMRWDITFLGVNPAGGFEGWVSDTLLSLKFGYNTHAVSYNKGSMDYILSETIDEPIDNNLVRCYMKNAKILATFPLLFSQTPGYSDIGKAHTDWTKEIEYRYSEQLQILKHG